MRAELMSCAIAPPPVNDRLLYQQLYAGELKRTAGAAADFVERRLAEARQLEHDLPADPAELEAWVVARALRVGAAFQDYLAERKAGAPRRFFTSRAHALFFLRRVAPTKLVDGAWLYGLVRQGRDLRLADLITIYLDELGEGSDSHNHVAVYRRLLAEVACDDGEPLPDHCYLQGATQLALGHLAERYLPEVIGYNLGYEQPPLHLLITSHELAELGIDPWYFTLHVTVDNAASGHARRAARGLAEALPLLGDRDRFWQRVRDGFALSELGPGSLDAIAAFDLDSEVIRVLEAKAVVGRCVHADRARVGGRTVNDWLSEPGVLPDFLQALQQQGWIVRGEAPERSRFWQLLTGPGASMFGVFTGYEQQLLADWIRADAPAPPVRRPLLVGRAHPQPARGLRVPLGAEEQQLLQTLATCHDEGDAMAELAPLLAPHAHWTPVGLLGTRLYGHLLRGATIAQALAREQGAATVTGLAGRRHELH